MLEKSRKISKVTVCQVLSISLKKKSTSRNLLGAWSELLLPRHLGLRTSEEIEHCSWGPLLPTNVQSDDSIYNRASRTEDISGDRALLIRTTTPYKCANYVIIVFYIIIITNDFFQCLVHIFQIYLKVFLIQILKQL